MEISAAKLEAPQLRQIVIDPLNVSQADAFNLIRHIEWLSQEVERLGDEVERVSEERDEARDQLARSGVASVAKRAQSEATDAKALLASVRAALCINPNVDVVAATRSTVHTLQRNTQALQALRSEIRAFMGSDSVQTLIVGR